MDSYCLTLQDHSLTIYIATCIIYHYDDNNESVHFSIQLLGEFVVSTIRAKNVSENQIMYNLMNDILFLNVRPNYHLAIAMRYIWQ